MNFSVDDSVFAAFPEPLFGFVMGRHAVSLLDSARIESIQEEAKRKLVQQASDAESLSRHPHVVMWSEAYRRMGVNLKRTMPTHEAFARRLLKGGGWPSINAIVDLYLANQVTHLLPHGGYDLSAVAGPISLLRANAEPFEPLGGGIETTYPGELVYRDSARILTRHWNWRDCEPTKITPTTTNFLLMIEAPTGVETRDGITSACRDLVRLFQNNFHGEFEYVVAALNSGGSNMIELPCTSGRGV